MLFIIYRSKELCTMYLSALLQFTVSTDYSITGYRFIFILIIVQVSRHTVVCRAPKKPARNPVSILTGRKKRNFRTSVALCCLDETTRILLWILTPPLALHISNLSEITSSIPEICNFKNWLSFFVFFLLIFLPLFAHLQKLL